MHLKEVILLLMQWIEFGVAFSRKQVEDLHLQIITKMNYLKLIPSKNDKDSAVN